MATVGVEAIEGAHASNTAGRPATAVAKQLNLQPTNYNVPKYKWSKISPLTGATFANMGAGSTQEILFEIPTKVHNMARSVLSYLKDIADQGAGKFAWDWADTLGEIYEIQLYTRGGIDLLKMTNANVMMKVMASKEVKATEVAEDDSAGLLKPCRTPAGQNYVPTAGMGTLTGNVDYVEKKYLNVGAVGTNANPFPGTLERKVDFRLGQLVNTHLALDKDLVYPDILILRIVFMSNKAGFSSTSNVDPTAGAAALVAGSVNPLGNTPAGIASCVYLSNIALYLALEQRPDVIAECKAQMQRGMQLYVPYTWVYKYSIMGSQITVSSRLDSAQGLYLKKAITVCMAPNETANTTFDHSNLPAGAAPTTAGRVNAFHTELDNERLQEFDYVPTISGSTDWLEVKENLKGSILQTRHQFYRNWFVVDNWLPESPDAGMKGGDALGGIDIHTRQRKYDTVFTNMADANSVFNWYHIFVTTRKLTITPTEIKLQ